MKLVTDFNTRLLDRIGSVKDFSEFLQTPGGAQFMDTLTADKGPIGPRDRILRATQTGIVLASVGIGCLFLTAFFSRAGDNVDVTEPFTIVGAILLSLGIGFLAAASASYALSRRLGLLQPPNTREDLPVSSR